MLFRRRDQSSVNDLPTPRQIAGPKQLSGHAIKQGGGTCDTDPVFKDPDRGAVGNIGRIDQAAKALVAHAVEQLKFHLLVR